MNSFSNYSSSSNDASLTITFITDQPCTNFNIEWESRKGVHVICDNGNSLEIKPNPDYPNECISGWVTCEDCDIDPIYFKRCFCEDDGDCPNGDCDPETKICNENCTDRELAQGKEPTENGCECPPSKPFFNAVIDRCAVCIEGSINPDNPCLVCKNGKWVEKNCGSGSCNPKTGECDECLNSQDCAGRDDGRTRCNNGKCECEEGFYWDPVNEICKELPKCEEGEILDNCFECIDGQYVPIEMPDGYVCIPGMGPRKICNCDTLDGCDEGSACVEYNSEICYCKDCGESNCGEGCSKGCYCPDGADPNEPCIPNPCPPNFCDSGADCGPDCGCITLDDGTKICVPCDSLPCDGDGSGCTAALGCNCDNGECSKDPDCNFGCPDENCDDEFTLEKEDCTIKSTLTLKNSCTCPVISIGASPTLTDTGEELTPKSLKYNVDLRKVVTGSNPIDYAGHSINPLLGNNSHPDVADNELPSSGNLQLKVEVNYKTYELRPSCNGCDESDQSNYNWTGSITPYVNASTPQTVSVSDKDQIQFNDVLIPALKQWDWENTRESYSVKISLVQVTDVVVEDNNCTYNAVKTIVSETFFRNQDVTVSRLRDFKLISSSNVRNPLVKYTRSDDNAYNEAPFRKVYVQPSSTNNYIDFLLGPDQDDGDFPQVSYKGEVLPNTYYKAENDCACPDALEDDLGRVTFCEQLGFEIEPMNCNFKFEITNVNTPCKPNQDLSQWGTLVDVVDPNSNEYQIARSKQSEWKVLVNGKEEFIVKHDKQVGGSGMRINSSGPPAVGYIYESDEQIETVEFVYNHDESCKEVINLPAPPPITLTEGEDYTVLSADQGSCYLEIKKRNTPNTSLYGDVVDVVASPNVQVLQSTPSTFDIEIRDGNESTFTLFYANGCRGEFTYSCNVESVCAGAIVINASENNTGSEINIALSFSNTITEFTIEPTTGPIINPSGVVGESFGTAEYTITNPVEGEYTITVRDNKGCEETRIINYSSESSIPTPSCSTIASSSVTQSSACTGATASATIDVTRINALYSYNLEYTVNGGSPNTITNFLPINMISNSHEIMGLSDGDLIDNIRLIPTDIDTATGNPICDVISLDDSLTVQTTDQINIAAQAVSSTICNGSDAEIEITGPSGTGYTIEDSNSNVLVTGTIPVSGVAVEDVTYSIGNNQYIVINESPCGNVPISISIMVEDAVTLEFDSGYDCTPDNSQYSFTVVTSANVASIMYNTTTNSTPISSTPSNKTWLVQGINSGEQVNVTADSGSCSVTKTFGAHSCTCPTYTAPQVASDYIEYCPGSPIPQAQVTMPDPNTDSIEWEEDGNIVVGATGLTYTPTVEVLPGQPFTIRVRSVNTTNGCESPWTSINYYKLSMLDISFSASHSTVCDDGSVNSTISATVTGGSGDYSYNWDCNGVIPCNILSGETTDTIEVNESGTYRLTVTDNISGCTSSGTIFIGSEDCTPACNIIAGINGVTRSSCENLTATASGGSGVYDFEWYEDVADTSGSPAQTGPTYDASGYAAGETRSITLKAIDRNNPSCFGEITRSYIRCGNPNGATITNLQETVINNGCNRRNVIIDYSFSYSAGCDFTNFRFFYVLNSSKMAHGTETVNRCSTASITKTVNFYVKDVSEWNIDGLNTIQYLIEDDSGTLIASTTPTTIDCRV